MNVRMGGECSAARPARDGGGFQSAVPARVLVLATRNGAAPGRRRCPVAPTAAEARAAPPGRPPWCATRHNRCRAAACRRNGVSRTGRWPISPAAAIVIVFPTNRARPRATSWSRPSTLTQQALALPARPHRRGGVRGPAAAAALSWNLPQTVLANSGLPETAFTARWTCAPGATTGIPAAERARTIQALADPATRPEDRPGPGTSSRSGPPSGRCPWTATATPRRRWTCPGWRASRA